MGNSESESIKMRFWRRAQTILRSQLGSGVRQANLPSVIPRFPSMAPKQSDQAAYPLRLVPSTIRDRLVS